MTMGVGISARLRATAVLVLACAAASLMGPAGRAIAATGGPASVTVSDVTVTEGNPGSTVVATFTLKVNKKASGSLSYGTANGTAKAPSDYVAKSGTLKFKGKGSKKVSVTIITDAVDE